MLIIKYRYGEWIILSSLLSVNVQGLTVTVGWVEPYGGSLALFVVFVNSFIKFFQEIFK